MVLTFILGDLINTTCGVCTIRNKSVADLPISALWYERGMCTDN